ncbi:hypothetical protein F4810DRAFT_711792 [Camillea tinctor]|nr:hypothetical protein F4810DRAFT_711792 [Camillea tinctor]
MKVFRASWPRLARQIPKGLYSKLQYSFVAKNKFRRRPLAPLLLNISRHITLSNTSEIGDAFVIPGQVVKAQEILGYVFKAPEILWEALQAPGSDITALNGRPIPNGNKPLAGVGDKVFGLLTVLDSYERGDNTASTAVLLRTVVSNYQLATTCDNFGLTECINQNPSGAGVVSPRTRADTVEAIIGAAFRDGGLDAARQVVKRLKLF